VNWQDLFPTDYLACDTETTGLIWHHNQVDVGYYPARPFCFTFTNSELESVAYTFPVDPRTREVLYYETPWVLEEIQSILATDTPKVFHNAQFDLRMYALLGLEVNGPIEDTRILTPMVRSDRPSFGLKPICKTMFAFGDEDQEDLAQEVTKARRKARKLGWRISTAKPTPCHPQGPTEADYLLGPIDKVITYGIKDTERTMRLWLSQKELLTQTKQPS
jgi:DNA polymerase I-like protein with 3'-5' exonuclease and polymerase domains